MDYLILSMIIVFLIAVLYVWWFSDKLYNIPPDQQLRVSHHNDIIDYSKLHTSTYLPFDFSSSSGEYAHKVLNTYYQVEVPVKSNYFVMGSNLRQEYEQMYRKEIPAELVWDLRSQTGLNVQIAIIPKQEEREYLASNCQLAVADSQQLAWLLNHQDESKLVSEYLASILKDRWQALGKYIKPDPLDSTYALLTLDQARAWNIALDKYGRLNMLCSVVEFEQLYRRLHRSANSIPEFIGS